MGANGNRRQTLRNNIIQPYETGLLTDVNHKDYNAVVGIELDKVSTATKHMFQGLDDVRKEIKDRTKALDALHLTVNDTFNKVMLEISGVKMQIGQGITMDSITDADGNVLSGVLQGLKTQVNAANGNIMVALGEITNTNTKFDGEILKISQDINGVQSNVNVITGVLYTGSSGTGTPTSPAPGTKFEQIAKHEVDITNQGASITQQTAAITRIDNTGGITYETQWGVKSSVGGLNRGVGFVQNAGGSTFTINADVFQFTGGGSSNGTLPFYIDATGTHIKQASIGNVTINAAQINTGVINSARIGDLQSTNFPNGGWQLTKAGSFQIGGNAGGNRIVMTSQNIIFYDGNGTPRIKIGLF